jgi:ATP-dependent Clp protease ATP-binding subunit ClpA
MTERSIRMPFIKSRAPFVMVPGGRKVPWPPNDDRFTDQAKQALVFSQDEAARLDHNHIGPVHLLVGAVRVEDGLPAQVFGDLGVTIEQVREALASTMGRGESSIDASDITLTPHAEKVMQMAMYETLRLGRPGTGTEHLFLAVVREAEHFSSQLLASLGLEPQRLREAIFGRLDVPLSYGTAENATPREGPYDRFDDASKQTLVFAQEEAARMGHHWVGGEQLLLGLARSADGAAPDDTLRRVFAELGLTLDRLRTEVAKVQPARTAQVVPANMKFNGAAKLIIELAIDEAGAHKTVFPEHLFLGMGRARDSLSGYVVSQLGATPERIRSVITKHRSP